MPCTIYLWRERCARQREATSEKVSPIFAIAWDREKFADQAHVLEEMRILERAKTTRPAIHGIRVLARFKAKLTEP